MSEANMRGVRRGLTAEDALVEHAGLGEVSDLRGPANDERSRQKKVLKDGAEQGRGRYAFGLGGEDCRRRSAVE